MKGLDEDESKFLEFVETRQQEISRERKQEERQLLEEMKISLALVTKHVRQGKHSDMSCIMRLPSLYDLVSIMKF